MKILMLVVFPYTSNDQIKNEIKNIITIKTVSKRIKYLGKIVTRVVRLIFWKLQNIIERN